MPFVHVIGCQLLLGHGVSLKLKVLKVLDYYICVSCKFKTFLSQSQVQVNLQIFHNLHFEQTRIMELFLK